MLGVGKTVSLDFSTLVEKEEINRSESKRKIASSFNGTFTVKYKMGPTGSDQFYLVKKHNNEIISLDTFAIQFFDLFRIKDMSIITSR
jgi:hypothetical protein